MSALLKPFANMTPAEMQIAIDREMCRRSLAEFARRAWHVLEPPTQPCIWEWPHDAICDHLEAVSRGEILRLLMNVPPGSMKSLLTNVFFPAWEWGPQNLPHLRIIGAAHNVTLATRDARKMRLLIGSDWYQARWGQNFSLVKDTEAKFENDKTGFRAAFPATSITGERGDRLNFDDPHSVDGANSDAERQNVVRTFHESMTTRLNNPEKSSIVVIMQRLHHEDVSGAILAEESNYVHLCLPMEFEPGRRCRTKIGFIDPREEDGEPLFPKRYPPAAIATLKQEFRSPYAIAGQLQQRPEPRGGGILKRAAWLLWDRETAETFGIVTPKLTFPPFDFVVASLDTAYTEKEENDACAMTIWGVFRDGRSFPQIMLTYAWNERLEFNALIEKIEVTCKKYRVDLLLIESKASGLSAAQEIRRRAHQIGHKWTTQLVDPGRIDKVARAYAVQGMLDDGMVYAPNTRWAEMVINQCAVFPKGAHDDLVDTVTQALNYMRTTGMARHEEEVETELLEMRTHKSQKAIPLYPS